MTANDIIGSYRLVSFEITKGTVTRPWRNNPHGLLIYSPDGAMSVAINADLDGDRKSPDTILKSTLFYSGTYSVNGKEIVHQVTEATDPTRIGKSLIRQAHLNGRSLTLIGGGDFGEAKVVWEKL